VISSALSPVAVKDPCSTTASGRRRIAVGWKSTWVTAAGDPMQTLGPGGVDDTSLFKYRLHSARSRSRPFFRERGALLIFDLFQRPPLPQSDADCLSRSGSERARRNYAAVYGRHVGPRLLRGRSRRIDWTGLASRNFLPSGVLCECRLGVQAVGCWRLGKGWFTSRLPKKPARHAEGIAR